MYTHHMVQTFSSNSQNTLNEQKIDLNQSSRWCSFVLKASLLQLHLHVVFEGTRLVSWSKHIGELSTDILRMQPSSEPLALPVLPGTLMMLRPGLSSHHFQNFLFLFTLRIVLNDLGCVSGVTVLLQNKFHINRTPP